MRTFKPRWASFYVAVGSNDDVIDSHEHSAEAAGISRTSRCAMRLRERGVPARRA
jgi:hypothetical protein